MSFLGGYIIRITVAALICAIALNLVDKKGIAGKNLKLICGIFMSVTMVSPFLQLNINSLPEFLEDIQIQADEISLAGENSSKEEMATIIKTRTQAYILDKAMSYGGQLTVEVRVDTTGIPTPCEVFLSGTISPYGKTQLQEMINRDLGIPMEAQIWQSS